MTLKIQVLAWNKHNVVLFMFMLSFNIVIVCGHFEWKRISAVFLSFVYTFVYALPLEIQLFGHKLK
jgi:hypothetical protein